MHECNMAAYEYENDNAKIVLECNVEEGEFNLTIYDENGGLIWDTDAHDLYETMGIHILQRELDKLRNVKVGGVFKYDGDYYVKANDYQAFNILRNEFTNFVDTEVNVQPVKSKLFIEE